MNCNSSIFSPSKRTLYFIALLAVSAITHAVGQTKQLPPVSVGATGRLVYTPDAQGNRVPDFSYSGYMAGEQPIPDAPIRVVVPLQKGDATPAIQAALDYVATLPADRSGIRGAVLLAKGTHEVAGGLKIKASGVVLRGSGMGAGGTVLLGTGQDRQTLVSIAGKDNRARRPAVKVTEAYVPVNATKLQVASSHSFKVGDRVLVQRPSTQAWIDALEANDFGGNLGYIGWKPGERDIFWDRTIVAVAGNALTLDAPITTALDQQYGGGNIVPYSWPGRISQVGVENLTCRSAYDTDNPKDEAHRWMAITMESARDAWVRQVVFEHFAGSAVAVLETASRVTVEDCKSLAPVSEIGGHRRYTFFTLGQQTLFQRLYAEYGYHDFAVGYCAAGPNAFVQCQSYLPYSFSGAIDSWASGILFDVVNVDGQALSLKNRMQEANGAGWSGANSMLWQCSASQIDCYKPPTANNWAFGVWAQFAGNGYWYEENSHINPYSLYYAQLSDRLGAQASERAQLLRVETDATSSPTVAQAATLTALAVDPAPVLPDWIDQASKRHAIPVDASNIKTLDKIGYKAPGTKDQPVKQAEPMRVQHGRLVFGNAVLTGKQYTVPWWRGTLQPQEIKKSKPHITRYVPGRNGNGLTDELSEVAQWMQAENMVAIDHNYGLWYDRRRDDHERVRRMNGEVWAPFYELPYARSGQGTAWDGLSKYDLTKFNYWYWNRLKRFADIADQKGLVLLHQNYFQHNILEAGAHYADFPWRPANNINATGFPEPPPYAGEKRIFLAEQFYDIKDPVRRELHKVYIRKCLDSFAENNSVIQLISAEYTGPLAFTQFWLDTILEWEKETGKQANVGLSVTKDVQDAILADPVRAAAVDLIDIRYWWYREDGSVYSPVGGQNLAPRQYARLNKSGRSSFEVVYRTVQEFRQRFPEKAVVYSAGGHDNNLAWGSFLAGGSLAGIPTITEQGFLADAASMQPVSSPGTPPGQWTLGNGGKGYIIYSESASPLKIDLSGSKGMYKACWIDPKDGHTLKKMGQVKGGEVLELSRPTSGPVVLWITKFKTPKS